MAVLILACSLLPLLGYRPESFAQSNGLLLLLLGFTLTENGVLDHRLLVGAMKPLAEEDNGGAV